ncbi:MarR family transcriptional regulator [Lachnospiraceae bacterium JLR.KK008]
MGVTEGTIDILDKKIGEGMQLDSGMESDQGNGGADTEKEPLENMKLRLLTTMRLIERAQKSKFDMELEQVGLTAAQMQVLIYLLRNSDNGKEITARELEKRFQVSNPTMSGILKRLEKKQFIMRLPGSIDKRNKQIKIRGDVEIFGRLIEARVGKEMERMFAGFTPQEIETLLQLITKLLHNIKLDRNEE